LKLEDFAYAVAQKVLHELEHTHHFKVPDAIRKAILEQVKKDLNTLVR